MKTLLESVWFERLREMDKPRVLEIGTAGWDGRPAHTYFDKIREANQTAIWRGLDNKEGDDVNIVADLHDLSAVTERFDAIFCPYVLEHVRKPWVVAYELLTICNAGAILFVQTHQSFPVHKYPDDFWRFSIEALEMLFGDAGWQILDIAYAHPAKVVPLMNGFATTKAWNFEASAYLNSEILAKKT